MNMNSTSLSYLFLAIAVIDLAFVIYFKVLVMNTSENNSHRNKIIGNMKDPADWRSRNNRMSYIFLFWTLASFGVFVYLKYFYGIGLVSLLLVIGFLALMVLSIALFGIRRKTTA
jgi:polyferredoxin